MLLTPCDYGPDCTCIPGLFHTHCFIFEFPFSLWTLLFVSGFILLVGFAIWIRATSYTSLVSTETIRYRQKLRYFWIMFAANIGAQCLALTSMERNGTPFETELLVVIVSSACYALWLCLFKRRV